MRKFKAGKLAKYSRERERERDVEMPVLTQVNILNGKRINSLHRCPNIADAESFRNLYATDNSIKYRKANSQRRLLTNRILIKINVACAARRYNAFTAATEKLTAIQ